MRPTKKTAKKKAKTSREPLKKKTTGKRDLELSEEELSEQDLTRVTGGHCRGCGGCRGCEGCRGE